MTKIEFDNIREKLKELKELPNKELIEILEKTSQEFDMVKNTILSLTQYLDDVEEIYNKTLKEYETRNNG